MGSGTYLPNFGSGVNIALDTQQNRAVVSQKSAILSPAAAPEVCHLASTSTGAHLDVTRPWPLGSSTGGDPGDGGRGIFHSEVCFTADGE